MIREANEAVRSVTIKQSAKRGSYAKFTPEQQAEVAKVASMHGITAAQRRFRRFTPTDQFFVHNCSPNLLKNVVTSHHRFHTISRFMTIATQLASPGPPAGGVNVPEHVCALGSTKIGAAQKKAKISAGGSTGDSVKICTRENILLYGTKGLFY